MSSQMIISISNIKGPPLTHYPNQSSVLTSKKVASFRTGLVSVAIFLALVFCCTRPPVPNGENTVSYATVEKKKHFPSEMQGYCLIRPGDKTIKARLMVTGEGDTIHAAVVDELGVLISDGFEWHDDVCKTRIHNSLRHAIDDAALFVLGDRE